MNKYFVGIRKDKKARICDFDPGKLRHKYNFAFGPFFSFAEAFQWVKRWKLAY